MADSSRSSNICPWDRGELCTAANGACLPPRKRLLAGLKQNGWLSSFPPYLQKGTEASCVNEELKLEVDLGETKHECSGDDSSSESPACQQGDCKATERFVSVKSKRPTKRRKSLSVLVDCHNSVKNLQPELPKSCSGGETKEEVRNNNASVESLLNSKREKESVSSYKEVVDAARATAATAAKLAAEARAIALEKAAAAAKAALIARAVLEAVILAAEGELPECQPSRHVWALHEQSNIGKELNCKFGSDPKASVFSPLPVSEGVDFPLEKKNANKRAGSNSAGLNEIQVAEKTKGGQSSTISFCPVDGDAALDRIKEGKHVDYGRNSILAIPTADVDTHFGKNKDTKQTQPHKSRPASCPTPAPIDDEKLARQLHRAMNSSPRISRSRACSDYYRKSEASLSSSEGCSRIKYQQVGGGSSSGSRKQIQKDKLQAARVSGKADVKVKSMMVINETLNMLQKAAVSRYHVLGSTRSDFAASDEFAESFSHREDIPMPVVSSHAFASSPKYHKEGDASIGTCKVNGSKKSGLKAKGSNVYLSSYAQDSSAMGKADESGAIKSSLILKKSKLRRRKQISVSNPVSPQGWDDNRVNTLPSVLDENMSEVLSDVATEQAGKYPETSDDEDHKGRGENQDGRIVSGLGSIAGDDDDGESTIKTSRVNSFCSKPSTVVHKISHLSLHEERHKRGHKILRVLANGLSEVNQNFGRGIPSYTPSPTVS